MFPTTSRNRILKAIFFFLLSLISFPLLGNDFPGTIAQNETVQIWTDESGVPNVVASSTAGAYWGYGYVLARERMFQLELLRRSVKGTLSELFGKSFVEADYTARRDGVSEKEMAECLSRSPESFKVVLSAFTSGINVAVTAALRRKIRVDPAFAIIGIKPDTFSEIDILNIFAGTMAVQFNDFTQELDNLHFLNSRVKQLGAKNASRIFEDVVFFDDPLTCSTLGPLLSAPTQIRHPALIPYYENPSMESIQSPTLRNRKRNQMLKTLGIPEKSGSYAVALSNRIKGKSEAFILAGPQMGYFKPSALFEIGLHTPEFDLIGATPAGYLAILFGANRKLGFTATAGVANLVDIIAFRPSKNDPNILVSGNFKVSKRSREEKIFVRGEKKPAIKIVEETDLGPVFAVEGKVHFVKNRGWKDRIIDSYAAWFDSNHSKNLDEWFKASDRMALSINWIGADSEGRLGYSYCGLGKTRKSFGDDRLPAPGPTDFQYPDIRVSGQEPKLGYYVNWNSPPFDGFRNGDLQTAWGRDQRTGFLEEIVGNNRDKWSVDFLKDLDRKIAFQDLRAYFFRDVLCRFIKSDALSKHYQDAFAQLTGWDGTRKISGGSPLFDHPGAGIFDAFWTKLFTMVFSKPMGDFLWMISSDPTWTQSSIIYSALKGTTNFDYFKGTSPGEVITSAFKGAVDSLASEGKPIPCVPCPPMEFQGANHVGAPTQVSPATFTPFMNRGSIVQIMSLTPKAIEVWAVLPPGNGTFGGFEKDQLSDFENFKYRKRPLLLEDVRRSAKFLQVIRYSDN